MMLGPGSRVTVVEKAPKGSTGTETPFTLSTARDPVYPSTGWFGAVTMVWSLGSVTRSRNGRGSKAREVTTMTADSWSPFEPVATTSNVLTPGPNSVSARNPPLASTAAGWPATVTEAPGAVDPYTTTAASGTVVPLTGAVTCKNRSGPGKGPGLGLGPGPAVGAGLEVGMGVGMAVAVGIGMGVGVGAWVVGVGVGAGTVGMGGIGVGVGAWAVVGVGTGVAVGVGGGLVETGAAGGSIVRGTGVTHAETSNIRAASVAAKAQVGGAAVLP